MNRGPLQKKYSHLIILLAGWYLPRHPMWLSRYQSSYRNHICITKRLRFLGYDKIVYYCWQSDEGQSDFNDYGKYLCMCSFPKLNSLFRFQPIQSSQPLSNFFYETRSLFRGQAITTILPITIESNCRCRQAYCGVSHICVYTFISV